MHKSDTQLVHGGRETLRDLGVHALPIDLSSTYPVQKLKSAGDAIQALAEGAPSACEPIYARLHNPTVARFENAMAGLEGATDAVAFASGMAALTAVFMAARQRGRHIIALRPLYGGTDHLLASGLLDIDVTFASADDFDRHITDETSLIVLETPANPTLQLVDIQDVVARAGDVPVMVDSTFATPILQQPLELGATLVIHSATKYIGGHGDAVGGVVATNGDWAPLIRQVRIGTGALLHPLSAYLLHRGLQTLGLRVKAAQRNAQELAARLNTHPLVDVVHYPGLAGCDPHGLVGRQMSGPGGMLALEVRGGFDAAARVIEGVNTITPAVSLGSPDSLIQHPASLTHRIVDQGAREEFGISPSLIRLSVGIEDVDDLWDDLSQALARTTLMPVADAQLA